MIALVGDREREFLFAQLAVHEIMARPELLSNEHRDELETLLGGDHRTLFAAAVARLTANSRAVRPLLEALALARGRGVPRADRVWALVADALMADTEITERDIDHVLDAAAPYIMLDGGDGQSVYRLAHRTFQEFFVGPRPADGGEPLALEDSHRRVANMLIADARESRVVNPYIVHRLAEHVSEGGMWEKLAETSFVLDHLDPESVAAEALRTAYGRADLPLAIAASLSARHLLSMIGPDDRMMTRNITMACIQSSNGPWIHRAISRRPRGRSYNAMIRCMCASPAMTPPFGSHARSGCPTVVFCWQRAAMTQGCACGTPILVAPLAIPLRRTGKSTQHSHTGLGDGRNCRESGWQ